MQDLSTQTPGKTVNKPDACKNLTFSFNGSFTWLQHLTMEIRTSHNIRTDIRRRENPKNMVKGS